MGETSRDANAADARWRIRDALRVGEEAGLIPPVISLKFCGKHFAELCLEAITARVYIGREKKGRSSIHRVPSRSRRGETVCY